MSENVTVRVRDCACPDIPHTETGDLVYLHPTLSLEGGIAAQQDLIDAGTDTKLLTRSWLVTFVRYGFAGASFPLSVDDLLADYSLASPVAERANDLYAESVLRPLGLSLSTPSAGGPTGGSTSAPKPSRRASRA